MDERCPACGDTADFCLGHTGDARSERVVANHDEGRHHACSPIGCDEAFDASVARIIEAQQIGARLS